jgi:hypothetical protein
MNFWEINTGNKRKVLVVPNYTNSRNLEADSFVDVMCNHIRQLGDEFFWYIPVPKLIQKFNAFKNVEQCIIKMSGDMFWMRVNMPTDMIKLLYFKSNVEYDVIYSHLPDWSSGRFATKPIIGYAHWFEFVNSNGISNFNRWLNFEHEVLGVLQMNKLYVNTKTQKAMILDHAKQFFNDRIITKLDNIIDTFYLTTNTADIIDTPKQNNNKLIVFPHRVTEYKGWPKIYTFLKKYREVRQDWKLWLPQADASVTSFDEDWIVTAEMPKDKYLNELENCRVCLTPNQTHNGWSVASTDSMSKGCPVIFGDCDAYRELHPNGLFYASGSELKDMLDKILDSDAWQSKRAYIDLERAKELSINDKYNELKALLLDTELQPVKYKDYYIK